MVTRKSLLRKLRRGSSLSGIKGDGPGRLAPGDYTYVDYIVSQRINAGTPMLKMPLAHTVLSGVAGQPQDGQRWYDWAKSVTQLRLE